MRPLRSRLVQSLLAEAARAYVELIIATLRWRIENRDVAELLLRGDEGFIALFWHGRIAHAMACRPVLGDKPRSVMISLSRDGGFIARAAERLGIPTIRGSTGRGEGVLEKGGATAFRESLAVIEAGGVMLLTPDGPRGPAEQVQAGPARMARAADCPVVLMGLAARPSITLGSWDGGRLPLPFARAALVLDGPVYLASEADAAALEAARVDWTRRLRAAQTRAEILLAAR